MECNKIWEELISSMRFKRKLSERGTIALIALGHCVNDSHAVFLPTLLPKLVEELGLSITQVGFFGFISGLTHVVGQPLFGHMADTTNRPWYMGIGPMVTALGIGLLPYAPNYALMMLFVGVYSMGSAAFHPQGCGSVGALISPEKLAFGISIFNMGGMLGSTLSPYYAILIISLFGLKGLPLAIVPALLVGGALLWFIPVLGELPDTQQRAIQGNAVNNIFRVLKKVFPIWSISFLRNASTRSITFFLPLLTVSRGGTILEGGTLLFVTSLSGTAAAVVGGKVADKVGKPLFIGVMLALGPLFLFPAIYAKGVTALLLYVAGLSCLRSTIPVTAARAVEVSPESRSVAGSLMMGVSWGLAGLVAFPLGWVADSISIEFAMASTLFLAWFGIPILLRHKIRHVLQRF